VSTDPNDPRYVVQHFARLENLILDDNNLAGPVVFQALAGLPALTFLSLNHNRITFVPRLVAEGVELDEQAALPFPALEIFSATHNRFAAPQDVLQVASWPRLRELHLAHNPLATSTRRLQPELQHSLVDICGIELLRKPFQPEKPRPVLDRKDVVTVKTPRLPPLFGPNAPSLLDYAESKISNALALEAAAERLALPDLVTVWPEQQSASAVRETAAVGETLAMEEDSGGHSRKGKDGGGSSNGGFFLTETGDYYADEEEGKDPEPESTGAPVGSAVVPIEAGVATMTLATRPGERNVLGRSSPETKRKLAIVPRNPYLQKGSQPVRQPREPAHFSEEHAIREARRLMGLPIPAVAGNGTRLRLQAAAGKPLPAKYVGYEELLAPDSEGEEELETLAGQLAMYGISPAVARTAAAATSQVTYLSPFILLTHVS